MYLSVQLEDRQSLLEEELRDKVLKIEEVAEEKTKLYEETFAKYQGQLLGKYNELKTKMDEHFNSVFRKMQADTRKEFENMQQKFTKKQKELDGAFQQCKMKWSPSCEAVAVDPKKSALCYERFKQGVAIH